MTKTKHCCRCHRTKPVNAFSPDAHCPDGLYPWCKACVYRYRQQTRSKPKPKGTPAMRRCLCCGRMWRTPGPGKRICPHCTKANASVREATVFRYRGKGTQRGASATDYRYWLATEGTKGETVDTEEMVQFAIFMPVFLLWLAGVTVLFCIAMWKLRDPPDWEEDTWEH